ncbi:hypothetical protein RHMOL_Rhmol04G0276500 [Rhododendron molle]|uniref:Uncharacterized protein n=1 Tax=Rhododendron molle TaxID=49168 RepID=A0ACC0P687_RHOML|nr:hypothetical protein RHMOL_Rhmol04G0276500 [Rhododendron molle]
MTRFMLIQPGSYSFVNLKSTARTPLMIGSVMLCFALEQSVMGCITHFFLVLVATFVSQDFVQRLGLKEFPIAKLHSMSRLHQSLAIYDTMQYIRSPINTICLGQAASMGSLLLAAGAKGERRALPNATIMIHQPSGGYSGQAKDISIHTKQIIRVWDSLNELYAKHTGQTIEVIQKNMDRDYFMTPEEAKEFGIIDEVIDQRPMGLVADAVGDEGKDKGSK